MIYADDAHYRSQNLNGCLIKTIRYLKFNLNIVVYHFFPSLPELFELARYYYMLSFYRLNLNDLCESSPVISQPTFPTLPVIPIAEICGDGIDNNLDGITDENCVPETPVGPQQCLPGEEPGTTTLSLTSAGCVTSAPELPAPCTSTQQSSSSLQFFQHSTSPWKFDFGVVDGRGLVLQDITAGIKHLKSWSAPHSNN